MFLNSSFDVYIGLEEVLYPTEEELNIKAFDDKASMEELEEYSEAGDDPKGNDFDDIVGAVNYVGGLSYLTQLFLLMCN